MDRRGRNFHGVKLHGVSRDAPLFLTSGHSEDRKSERANPVLRWLFTVTEGFVWTPSQRPSCRRHESAWLVSRGTDIWPDFRAFRDFGRFETPMLTSSADWTKSQGCIRTLCICLLSGETANENNSAELNSTNAQHRLEISEFHLQRNLRVGTRRKVATIALLPRPVPLFGPSLCVARRWSGCAWVDVKNSW